MRFSLSSIKQSFKNSDKRTANVIRNTMASATMKIASLACSFVIVPLTINYLNPENYGIWMAMTSILYWVAFCDIGLGNGMRNYMAEAFSRKDFTLARSYFSTSVFILSIIALIIGVVAIPLIYTTDLNALFNTANIDARVLCNVFLIAICFTLVQFVVKNVGMVYVAMQKYAVNDLIIFLGSISSLLVVFVLTKTTEGNLTYVVTAFTALPALMFILSAIPLLRKHPELTPSIKSIDYSIAGKIASKGLGFFVIQITSCLVIFGSANILISHFCGPEQVTIYNIAFKLFNVLVIGYTILISPLWNAYTDAATKGDYEWIKKSFKRSLMMWLLSVLGGGLLLCMSGWIFELWIGESVKIPFGVSIAVYLYVCMFNFNNCVTYLINGLNKIRVQIITSVVVTIVYLIAVFLIKGDYGIIGISLSMMLAYFMMAAIHLYQCYLLANGKAKGIWNK